jgi:hypothetical protein|uniref:Uncharacterized protein n=1 Tax=Siphoviridae sp. ct3b712 TaxID=2826283 RepID=A0A8S5M3V5_9CAUD|nr:MAG TPA: hypothetical protein [Siphoviridae sp. ct3b712]
MIQKLSIFLNGAWNTLDPPSGTVAMNFQVNTLAEFKDRNASYSRAISLPRSLRNDRILGIQLGAESASQLPYRSFPCEFFADGLRVSPYGAILRVISLRANSIEAQILGSNAGLVEVLKSKSTETVEADGFGMVWMNSSIKASGTLPNGIAYHWVYANLVKNLLYLDDAGAPEGYIKSPDRVYPVLNFQGVVRWILKQEGYDLDLPPTTDQELPGEHDYIPALIPKCVQWDVAALPFEAEGGTSASSSGVTWRVSRTPIPGMWGPVKGNKELLYYAPWDGNILLRMQYTLANTSAILNVTKNGVDVITNYEVNASTTEVFPISLKAGDNLRIRVARTSASGQLFATALVATVPPRKTEGIAIGVQYDLLASLGFSTRADIVQEFMRVYGLTMQVNPVKNSILMYPLSYVIDRKEQAADWSGKVVPGKEELTYQVGNYAQKNTFGLKPDETNGIRSEYTFGVDDSNLDEAKDLWTSKFLAIAEVKNGLEDWAPNFPIYEVDRAGTERASWTLKYSTPNSPVIVRWLEGGTRSLRLIQGPNPSIAQVDNVSVAEIQGVPITYFANYHRPLWDTVLNKAKALRVTVNLNELDIETLDLSKPVWLEQYGHYFYISKVANYMPGKLTNVNLIQI